MIDILSITSIMINAAGFALMIQYVRRKGEMFWCYAAFAIGDVLVTIVNILQRDWTWAMVTGGLTVLMAALCQFWWRRRKRRGRLAVLGGKARARIAAMTRRMRERPARPALRPVPAGTR